MAEAFDSISDRFRTFIEEQHMYFVASAPLAADGHVNLSPKGGRGTLQVLTPNRVAWLNLTGSGNETAAHVRENGRMTVMFCSFGPKPLILRLFGVARCIHTHDPEWSEHYAHFEAAVGARQIFVLDVTRVQSSCGYAVPRYSLDQPRDTLSKWADKRGTDGIREYWAEKNRVSLDGLDTGTVTDARD